MGKAVTGLAETAAKQGTQLRDKIATDRELAELAKQETELLLEIGKTAYEANPAAWPQDERIRLTRERVAEIQVAVEEAAKAVAAGAAATVATIATPAAPVEAQQICPTCGQPNAAGVKFCSACGTKLDVKPICAACGAEMQPGTRFCGVCGAKVEN